MAPQDILEKYKLSYLNPENKNVMGGKPSSTPVMLTPPPEETTKEIDPTLPLLSQYFKETVQKPREISEKGMKASRTVANLGDTFSLLAEMVGAGKGAHISKRNVNGAVVQAQNERAVRAQNEAETDQYNKGLLSAKYQDANNVFNEQKQKRAYMQQLFLQKEQLKQRAEEKQLELQKWLIDNNLKATEANRRKFEADRKYNLDVFKANKVGSKTEKAPKITPAEAIQINKQAQDIPLEWLKKYGYVKTTIDKNDNQIDEWDSKVTPEMKRELIAEYKSEQKSQPIKPQYRNEYLPGGSQSPIKTNNAVKSR